MIENSETRFCINTILKYTLNYKNVSEITERLANGTGRAAHCLRLVIQKQDNTGSYRIRTPSPPVNEKLVDTDYNGPGYLEYEPILERKGE